jgi:PAS domain S-box-containing protein
MTSNTELQAFHPIFSKSEDVYRSLFTQSRDGIVIMDLDYVILEANQYLTDMLGYEMDELIGKSVFDFFLPEELEHAFRRAEQVNQGQMLPITERNIVRKDGNILIGEANLSLIRDAQGQPRYLLGTLRNITERKQHEEKDRLLTMLLDMLDGVCFIKNTEGVYQYINEAFETQFGVQREDVIGKGDTFVFGPANAALLQDNDRRIMATKTPEAVEESGYLGADKPVTFLTHKTPILDENGEVTGICGVGVNITYQKEIEDQLRQSEQKYRNLVEQVSDVIYSVDSDGVITYISPAVESFLGYQPMELIGQSFAQFIAPDDLSQAQETFSRHTIEELPGSREYRMVTKTGDIRWMQTSSKPVINNGETVGLQGVFSDITARKIAETQIKQAAVVAERERLARELHDSVTQTLYSVAAISQALPRIWERNPEQARSGLSELTTLTNAALAEMRTLLLELRPETLEKQDLVDLLHQLVDGMMGRTRLPITLHIDSNCDLPPDVRMALYRITQEALNNIVKHSRATQAEIRLARRTGGIALLIRDNGVGFNPQSISSHHLGLDIMRERAKNIAADFDIQSEPSRGTWVSVVWRD